MTTKDGRDAKQPYRVRAGSIWYWVDPTVPATDIEPGNTVIVYPLSGDTHIATLESVYRPTSGDAAADPIRFSTSGGERFEVAPRDIAALHLVAVDEVQD
jgi:hypothetical protein